VNLESKRPPKPLFRVGRDDDAWAVPDWAHAKEDRTFGNRLRRKLLPYGAARSSIEIGEKVSPTVSPEILRISSRGIQNLF
jgi:hypothetical protein